VKLIYGESSNALRLSKFVLLADREVTQEYSVQDSAAIVQITRAEVDLLGSTDSNTLFVHFERWKQTLIGAIPDEELIRVCNSILVDICLMICSAEVAATAHNVDTAILPTKTVAWIDGVRANYGAELLAFATESITAEKLRTMMLRGLE
jgi:hypothetical protein